LDANSVVGFLNDLWEFNPSTNKWAWMGGSSTMTCQNVIENCGQPGVYGTLGIAASGNTPGGRDGAASWTDKSGNLWLFGGGGNDANRTSGSLNDLWEFNPYTLEWTWMGGSSTLTCFATNGETICGERGVYGTLGTPAPGNIPGSPEDASTWTDNHGNLWLFGGWGFDANSNFGTLNDLWEFNPTLNEWTWMGGSSTVGSNCDIYGDCGLAGAYGTLGTPATGNIPGSRVSASAWTDSSGNLWLFGGQAFDSNDTKGSTNDLWRYQLAKTTPTLTVTPSSSSVTTVQALTVTVGVSGGTGYPTPTGSVTLSSGSYSSGGMSLTNGSAIVTIPANTLPMGTDTLAVSYAGDTNYNTNTGGAPVTVAGFTVGGGTTVSVTPGATTSNTSTITVTPGGGFTGAVALTATSNYPSADPAAPTFSFGPTSPVNIASASAGTATLTISTTAQSTSGCTAANRMPSQLPWYSGGGAVLACVLLFGIPARRRRWLRMLSTMALLIAITSGVVACGGGGGGGGGCTPTTNPGTTAGAYTVTVTGTSGAIVETTTLTLTVE
jgi:hypothetical protein